MGTDPVDGLIRHSPSLIPGDLPATEARLQAFVKHHVAAGTRIACVTSGGTTVPLETKTVRFIDNFSSGNRGAACTEYLLAQGYAVIFLHRRASVFPFKRHLDRADPLDVVQRMQAGTLGSSGADDALVRASLRTQQLLGGVDLADGLACVPFTTIVEYLVLLRSVCRALHPAGVSAMLVLAAAVSDFYIPEADMAQEKIQSTTEGLALTLKNVPKLLGCIKGAWAPRVFCVSFKLETNPNILRAKAAGALCKYQVDAVVANVLGQHTAQAHVIEATGPPSAIRVRAEAIAGTETSEVPVDGIRERLVCRQGGSGPGSEIEKPLVDVLVERHQSYISPAKQDGEGAI